MGSQGNRKITYISFTGTYTSEEVGDNLFLDLSGLSGTDMYCDEEAETQIQGILTTELGERPYEGIHFFDSGNYHYMTRIFTKTIGMPYVLVFFDHHTDMKPAMFDMLSCGSWAKAVVDKDPFLQKMLILGPPKSAVSDDMCLEKVCFLTQEDLQHVSEEGFLPLLPEAFIEDLKKYPIYLSLDKDVLGEEDAITNWDQGDMTLDQMKRMIAELQEAASSGHGINENQGLLGVDICGNLPHPAPDLVDKSMVVNQRTDHALKLYLLPRLTSF